MAFHARVGTYPRPRCPAGCAKTSSIAQWAIEEATGTRTPIGRCYGQAITAEGDTAQQSSSSWFDPKERPLAPEQSHHPAPESPQNPVPAPTNGNIVSVRPFLFGAASGGDLLGRPRVGPQDPALPYPVVRLARKLPIANRRTESRSAGRVFKSPVGGPQRDADPGPAPARTKVRYGTEFL